MELRRRAVYSAINERLKQVQEREEEELRCVIGRKAFHACSLTNSSSVRHGIHTFLCQSIAIEQITLRFSSFNQAIAITSQFLHIKEANVV